MFHRHQWEETGRVKLAGIDRATMGKMEGSESFIMELNRQAIAAMNDRTAIHLRCKTCGEPASRILDGWVEPS